MIQDRRRLLPNAIDRCPSRGCHVWHTAHGIDHHCGQDAPSHLRTGGITLTGQCPHCGGPAPVRGGLVQDHPIWTVRNAGDGRTLLVPSDEDCPGEGERPEAGAA